MKKYKTFEERVRALVQHPELISISVFSSNPFQEVADEFARERAGVSMDPRYRRQLEDESALNGLVVGGYM